MDSRYENLTEFSCFLSADTSRQAWLCPLIYAYEWFAVHKKTIPPLSGETEDPWHSILDDVRDFFSGSTVSFLVTGLAAALSATGTFVATRQIVRSTYICFEPLESRTTTLIVQGIGVAFDALIISMLWRVLIWTRTTKMRLRMLSNILLLASLSMSFLWLAGNLLSGTQGLNVGFEFLYATDVLVDSCAFAALLISATIWLCQANPLIVTSTSTILLGTWRSSLNVFSLGDWTHLSRLYSLGPLWLTSSGGILFVYSHGIRSVTLIRRPLFVALLVILLITATIFTFLRPLNYFDKRHPINDLIYEAKSQHDRWMVQATTSKTLTVAVTTYQESHGGKVPPPNFGDWYQFASGSTVIDDFHQIDRDLEVFSSVSPALLRKKVQKAATLVGVGNITVKDGQVSTSSSTDEANNLDLNEIAEMIKKFSRHLPDMVLPINLSPSPRVLPSWHDTNFQSQAYLNSIAKALSKRSGTNSDLGGAEIGQSENAVSPPDQTLHLTRASDFRRMLIEACPSASRVKTNPHWDLGQFCLACIKGHSSGQLLSNWHASLDICAQPDIQHLHAFALTDPSLPPTRELVPLFGGAKSEQFRDILLPFPQSRLQHPDVATKFEHRGNSLIWRGSIGAHVLNEQALRGSHKTRLLHLVKVGGSAEKAIIIVPDAGADDRFKSEQFPTKDASAALPFDAQMADYSACIGQNCDAIKMAYGVAPQSDDVLNSRYILLTDEDDGPSQEILSTLLSGSLPFISTIFKTWYSYRLTPWLHFVPIDPRYHALHSTLLYFVGTGNETKIGSVPGRQSDAEWIAQQGQRWAHKALGKKDMEIYLFRLLLEWGRLIDDKRDEIGFRQAASGEFQNDKWSRP